jgi:preprotein translocase subunit SecA
MIHYDVQLMVEWCCMKEKLQRCKRVKEEQISAYLAIVLECLNRKGVHLVTVNDYLERDGTWKAPLFEFGMTVDCIDNHQPSSEGRKSSLQCRYHGTNNEFGFDYLRDNMTHSQMIWFKENTIMQLSMRSILY